MDDRLRLGDHCLKIGSGATPRGGKDSYLSNGPYALIRSQNVLNQRFSRGGLAYIDEEQATALKNVQVLEGDVLLNITGDSVARACQVDASILPARVNQHVAIIRPDTRVIDSRYLRYYLIAPRMQNFMLGLAGGGATRNALTKGMIEDFRLPARPLKEQQEIGALLGSLDEKIDLNRRINETLEAMARAIFKDWFIDFGPTRAKMQGSLSYLAADLWAMFPNRLNQDEVPESWQSQDLGSVTSELRRGVSPKYSQEDGVLVLNQKCIRDRSVTLMPARRHDPSVRPISGRELRPGDILVNSTGVGTLGRTAQIWRIDEPTIVDSHVTVVRAAPSLSALYLGLNLTGRETEIEALAEGSTGQTELSRKRLAEMSVLIPSPAVLQSFDDIVRPFAERMEINRSESATLSATRDLLLPRLMSGEIRVREAEAMVAIAA